MLEAVLIVVGLALLVGYVSAIGFLAYQTVKARRVLVRVACVLGVVVLVGPVAWDFGKVLYVDHRARALVNDVRDGFEEATLDEYLSNNKERFGLSSWRKPEGDEDYYVVHFLHSKSIIG